MAHGPPVSVIGGEVRERTVFMRVLVHPAGCVQGGQVVRGVPSGSTLEQDLFRWIRQFSFHRAQRDGKPVPGWIEVPVVLRGA